MSTPGNNYPSNKNGLVEGTGEKSTRQTNITQFLHPPYTKTDKNLKKTNQQPWKKPIKTTTRNITKNNYSLNGSSRLTQTLIKTYLPTSGTIDKSPAHTEFCTRTPLHHHAPPTPRRAPPPPSTRTTFLSMSPLNLMETYPTSEMYSPSTHEPYHSTSAQKIPPHRNSRQTSLSEYFVTKPRFSKSDSSTAAVPASPSPTPRSALNKKRTVTSKRSDIRCRLLRYNATVDTGQTKITDHTVTIQPTETYRSWGHTLDAINTSNIFCLFLQNPNGITLNDTNYSLLHDLHTCQKYGAAVVALPETNVNWALPEQREQFFKVQKQTEKFSFSDLVCH
jgi:hypothetical protein